MSSENEHQLGAGESDSFKLAIDSVRSRLYAYAERAAVIAPDAPGSVEWLAKCGNYWWVAREGAGLTRMQAANTMGEDINRIRMFEVGLFDAEDEVDLPPKYSTALGKPELLEAFYKTLNFPQSNPQE